MVDRKQMLYPLDHDAPPRYKLTLYKVSFLLLLNLFFQIDVFKWLAFFFQSFVWSGHKREKGWTNFSL